MAFHPDLIAAVEWATVIVTFVMMASGMPVCISMYRQRSIANVPYLLFLISVLVSILGLHYGILMSNRALILVNVVAVLVWGTYVGTYILVSKSKGTPLAKLFAVVGVYLAHLYYLTTLPSHDVIPTLGTYLLVWCTVLCIVPAEEIIIMVQEKSTDSCNLPLLFGGTLSAVVWYLYGFLVNDANIYLPNIPALLVSGAKFFMIFLYGLPSQQTAKEKDIAGVAATDVKNNIKNNNANDTLRQRK